MVEDNPGDILLTKEVMKELGLNIGLDIATDGEQAIKKLSVDYSSNGFSKPDLIILDLNLPKKDGREVLKFLKTHPELKFIPVCVLTTSEADKDILDVYQLYANCYIIKPLDFNQYMHTFNTLQHFWFNTVKLPQNEKNQQN